MGWGDRHRRILLGLGRVCHHGEEALDCERDGRRHLGSIRYAADIGRWCGCGGGIAGWWASLGERGAVWGCLSRHRCCGCKLLRVVVCDNIFGDSRRGELAPGVAVLICCE